MSSPIFTVGNLVVYRGKFKTKCELPNKIIKHLRPHYEFFMIQSIDNKTKTYECKRIYSQPIKDIGYEIISHFVKTIIIPVCSSSNEKKKKKKKKKHKKRNINPPIYRFVESDIRIFDQNDKRLQPFDKKRKYTTFRCTAADDIRIGWI